MNSQTMHPRQVPCQAQVQIRFLRVLSHYHRHSCHRHRFYPRHHHQLPLLQLQHHLPNEVLFGHICHHQAFKQRMKNVNFNLRKFVNEY